MCIECAFMHGLQADTFFSAQQVILAEDTFRPGEDIVVIKILNSRNAAAGRRVGCHAPAWATKGCCLSHASVGGLAIMKWSAVPKQPAAKAARGF